MDKPKILKVTSILMYKTNYSVDVSPLYWKSVYVVHVFGQNVEWSGEKD